MAAKYSKGLLVLPLAVFCILQTFVLKEVECGGFVEDRACGRLFSNENFGGDAFVLKDFDQAVNLRKDYRTSTSGWWHTSSIRVELNCTMRICTGAYFTENCQSLLGGDHEGAFISSTIKSVNCECSRECSCNDIHVPKNERICGRVYDQNGCNKCDSKYIPLYYEKRHWNFHNQVHHKLLILRSGCSITLYRSKDKNTFLGTFTGPHINLQYDHWVASYECSCNDNLFIPQPRPLSYPPLISLPSAEGELVDFHLANHSSVNHLGIQTALKSLKNGRSSKTAYILLIGTFNPKWIGLHGCPDLWNEIGECSIAVDLDQFGIYGAQVRVIYAYLAGYSNDAGEDEDARWVLSLADYVSKHEELKDVIPNAVVVYHSTMNDPVISEKGSKFQIKLQAIEALRPLILDENYSNLFFLIDELGSLPASEQRNPEERIELFENAVTKNWSFPNPTHIIPRDTRTLDTSKINGYWKMASGEYWFRNLEESLKLAADKTGDALGHAIFNAAFPEDTQWTVVAKMNTSLLPENDTRIPLHKDYISYSIPRLAAQKKQRFDHRITELFNTTGESASETEQDVEPGSIFELRKLTNGISYSMETLKQAVSELKASLDDQEERIKMQNECKAQVQGNNEEVLDEV